MRPLTIGIGSAVAGAAVAAALIYAIPAFSPGDAGDEAAAAAHAAAPAQEGVVTLDRSALAHAGIHVATIAPAQVTAQRSGFARALDISTLAAIDSEIESARAALASSEADYRRQRALAADDQSAATRAVETARAQAEADRARVTAAERRVGLEYGPGLATLSTAALHDLVRAVASGDASLIRVDFPDGPVQRGASVHIAEGSASATATLIGAAAATDPRLQTAGSLAVVRGPVARLLGAGRVLPATIASRTGSESGALVPRDAILRFQGGFWVYRLAAHGGFTRIELQEARPESGGWFVRGGVKPGDRVATGGVGVLLSIERGAGPEAEDE